MTTPPDFGGREIEEGLEEDLGARPRERPEAPRGAGDSDQWADNEAHAVGKVCARCGAVIAPGQDARRRADGQWMHEICPGPRAE
jgi:hypothetical protein